MFLENRKCASSLNGTLTFVILVGVEVEDALDKVVEEHGRVSLHQ